MEIKPYERQEVQEAAGHLLAELYDVRELHRQGQINEQQFRDRVRIIRQRREKWQAVGTWSPTTQHYGTN